MHPPPHTVEEVGTAETRPSDGSLDIGAYEVGALFADGFESGDTTEWSGSFP
jgi:hypothetical protein